MNRKWETRIKQLEYNVPTDAEEIGWANVVLWREPKDGHIHIVAPYESRVGVSPQDRRALHRLGRAISKCVFDFHKGA